MSPIQQYWWRVGLELKLRQSSGEAFQDFFADLMSAAHGDGYVRVRPYGQLGDKGCDGYLASSGRVHACYGAVNADGSKVAYLIGKMETDFAKAKAHLGAVMKQWFVTHNLVDGLPIEAVLKLQEMEKANPGVTFGFAAMESMAEILLALPVARIETLVGPAATASESQNLDAIELKGVIDAVIAAVDESPAQAGEVKEVSPQKLAHNNLSGHWRQLLTFGFQNAIHVAAYFDKHPEPLTGERVAQRFRHRYAYLRAEHLSADATMSNLYTMILGVGTPSAARSVAAQALLAHLFESCDVLEDAPVAAAS